MRLLIAEDDRLLGSAIQSTLARAGYAIDWVQTGRDFGSALALHEYDCAVLDLGLPDTSGDVLLRRVRTRRVRIPVIVITARGDVADRIALLDEGADDYLVKPFDLNELNARIRSVMRRATHDPASSDVLVHGALNLFPQRYAVTWRGADVSLTHREFAVLEALVRKRNQVMSRAQLQESLYGWGEEVDSNTVEVYVHFLRRKIHPELIETIRGLGYRLATEYA
jgi:DNA-binding response OmpR family regulator